jgi:hypothetical protein
MHELKRFLRRRGIDANDLAAEVEALCLTRLRTSSLWVHRSGVRARIPCPFGGTWRPRWLNALAPWSGHACGRKRGQDRGGSARKAAAFRALGPATPPDGNIPPHRDGDFAKKVKGAGFVSTFLRLMGQIKSTLGCVRGLVVSTGKQVRLTQPRHR